MFTFNYAYQYTNNIEVHTTGCDLCVYDGRKFANTLDSNEKAIVFNTCSVFKEREVENRLLLSLLSKVYPEYKLYVLGCDVNNNPQNYEKYENRYYNYEVSEIINKHFEKDDINDNDVIYLKIQDGCRHKCSFCIINKLRNRPFSLPYKEILNNLRLEINGRSRVKLQIAGTELTNYYDKESGYRISDVLVHILSDCPEVCQISLTSIDPASSEVENIMKVINANRDRLIPHLNLAVQSGSDYILDKMKRRHSVDRIREVHELAYIYNIGLGWDIIVGFPEETEERYNETVALVKELRPLTRTIFAYSPRKGTESYLNPNQIPDNIKQYRLKEVTNIINGIIDEEYKKQSSLYFNYVRYINEGLLIDTYHKGIDIKRVYEYVLDTENSIDLDIYDEDKLADFVRKKDTSKVIHIRYDSIKQLEGNIYINFLKTYLPDIKLIVHFDKDFNVDVDEFTSHYPCIYIKKINSIVII